MHIHIFMYLYLCFCKYFHEKDNTLYYLLCINGYCGPFRFKSLLKCKLYWSIKDTRTERNTPSHRKYPEKLYIYRTIRTCYILILIMNCEEHFPVKHLKKYS
jgi:hypothetical protein